MTLSATEYNAAGKIRLHAAAEGAKETIPNDSPVEKVFEYLKMKSTAAVCDRIGRPVTSF